MPDALSLYIAHGKTGVLMRDYFSDSLADAACQETCQLR